MQEELLLTSLTKQELDKYMNGEYGEVAQDRLVTQFYRMAKTYMSGKQMYNLEFEDLVQEAVIRVINNLPKFDDTKSSLSTFAYMIISQSYSRRITIMNRKCSFKYSLELDRKVKNTKSGTSELLETLSSQQPSPLQKLVSNELYNQLDKYTKMLMEGYSTKQVAEHFNVALQTVYNARESTILGIRFAHSLGRIYVPETKVPTDLKIIQKALRLENTMTEKGLEKLHLFLRKNGMKTGYGPRYYQELRRRLTRRGLKIVYEDENYRFEETTEKVREYKKARIVERN